MKIIAINGGPRKGWNTDLLLDSALEGARSTGAETQKIHLYDLDFKGCVSCFACKRKGTALDMCAFRDGLTPALDAFRDCDGAVFGTPVYAWRSTGMLHMFMERAIYPYVSYEDRPSSFPQKIKTAFIYTMNSTYERAENLGYLSYFENNRRLMESVAGSCETFMSFETLQFENYSDYAITRYTEKDRRHRRETIFPGELREAFELGVRLAEK